MTEAMTEGPTTAATSAGRLRAVGDRLEAHLATISALLVVGTPERKGLAQAVRAAIADCRMGSRDGARAALSQLQGMHGALETLRASPGPTGELATAAAAAVPELQQLSGGWWGGPEPTGRETPP